MSVANTVVETTVKKLASLAQSYASSRAGQVLREAREVMARTAVPSGTLYFTPNTVSEIFRYSDVFDIKDTRSAPMLAAALTWASHFDKVIPDAKDLSHYLFSVSCVNSSDSIPIAIFRIREVIAAAPTLPLKEVVDLVRAYTRLEIRHEALYKALGDRLVELDMTTGLYVNVAACFVDVEMHHATLQDKAMVNLMANMNMLTLKQCALAITLLSHSGYSNRKDFSHALLNHITTLLDRGGAKPTSSIVRNLMVHHPSLSMQFLDLLRRAVFQDPSSKEPPLATLNASHIIECLTALQRNDLKHLDWLGTFAERAVVLADSFQPFGTSRVLSTLAHFHLMDWELVPMLVRSTLAFEQKHQGRKTSPEARTRILLSIQCLMDNGREHGSINIDQEVQAKTKETLMTAELFAVQAQHLLVQFEMARSVAMQQK